MQRYPKVAVLLQFYFLDNLRKNCMNWLLYLPYKNLIRNNQNVFISFDQIPRKEDALKHFARDFPCGAVVKNPPANAGDTGSSPGPGRSHMPRSN